MKDLFAALSRRERRAISILLGLAVAGHLLRAFAAAPSAPRVAAQLFAPGSDGDPIAHRDSIRRLSRPLGQSERVDVDHASADELARLPGIGPALARRIVADRESHGAFGGVAGLSRVHGMGKALITKLIPHLSFGGVPAEAQVTSATDPVDLNHATVVDLVGLPGIGPSRARAIIAFRDSVGPFRELDDLKRVAGITGALVKRLDGRVVVH
jgi:competence ComEA-like helix-hairpin-helix protein